MGRVCLSYPHPEAPDETRATPGGVMGEWGDLICGVGGDRTRAVWTWVGSEHPGDSGVGPHEWFCGHQGPPRFHRRTGALLRSPHGPQQPGPAARSPGGANRPRRPHPAAPAARGAGPRETGWREGPGEGEKARRAWEA